VTDEQILAAFKALGMDEFVKKFDQILDFEINEYTANAGTKNLVNIVRTILKPASIYVFNQCFEHVKHEYVEKLMEWLKNEQKTCVFISYESEVCKYCDHIYVLRKGKLSGSGTHEQLLNTNADYRNLRASSAGVILKEERIRHGRKKGVSA